MSSGKYLLISLFSVSLLNHVTDAIQSPIGRIINGEDAGFIPYAARVTGFSMDYSTEGSGTLITLGHILTSASIIYKMSIMFVYYGNESMGAVRGLSGLGVYHPDYDPWTFENDIGLITLGVAADPNYAIPIGLPPISNTPLVNEQGKVSGFGLRLDESRGWVLNFPMQTGYFRVIDEESCRERLGQRQEVMAESHFCTENQAGLCFGDHGSGFIIHLNDEDVLVGIVSVITNLCHGEYPVMFTQVAKYTSWIQEQMQTN